MKCLKNALIFSFVVDISMFSLSQIDPVLFVPAAPQNPAHGKI